MRPRWHNPLSKQVESIPCCGDMFSRVSSSFLRPHSAPITVIPWHLKAIISGRSIFEKLHAITAVVILLCHDLRCAGHTGLDVIKSESLSWFDLMERFLFWPRSNHLVRPIESVPNVRLIFQFRFKDWHLGSRVPRKYSMRYASESLLERGEFHGRFRYFKETYVFPISFN